MLPQRCSLVAVRFVTNCPCDEKRLNARSHFERNSITSLRCSIARNASNELHLRQSACVAHCSAMRRDSRQWKQRHMCGGNHLRVRSADQNSDTLSERRAVPASDRTRLIDIRHVSLIVAARSMAAAVERRMRSTLISVAKRSCREAWTAPNADQTRLFRSLGEINALLRRRAASCSRVVQMHRVRPISKPRGSWRNRPRR